MNIPNQTWTIIYWLQYKNGHICSRNYFQPFILDKEDIIFPSSLLTTSQSRCISSIWNLSQNKCANSYSLPSCSRLFFSFSTPKVQLLHAKISFDMDKYVLSKWHWSSLRILETHLFWDFVRSNIHMINHGIILSIL